MKNSSTSTLIASAICIATAAFGQTNYVATAPTSSTPGALNTLIGVGAGMNMQSGGSANTFIGFQAGMANTIAGRNTFVGFKAGLSNTTGIANVFVGSEAGSNNTTGIGNMFLGQQAGGQNTTGAYNLFVGNGSGSGTTTGLGNTAIGDGSLLQNVTGTRNTAIGQYAGVASTSDENVFIGFAADVTPTTPNLTNVVAIGARARVSQSNSIVLGNNANVGIGTSAPGNKLEIAQGTSGNSGLRFTNLPVGTSVSRATTDKFLTVNENGDVVLRRVDLSLLSIAVGIGGRLGATPWGMEGATISSGKSPVAIGDSALNVPAGYKLYVADGILTEKVKVAVKNSDEWADYVFAQDYKLRSLDEVKQFVNEHKHLPGVPSATDVVKQGVDVGQMQAKLLEKIEELTLYMLQLKEENQQLKCKLDELTTTKHN